MTEQGPPRLIDRKPPRRATPLTPEWVIKGLRAELPANRRLGRPRAWIGLLTGVLETSYPRPRVEVMVEGLSLSTLQTWAMADVILLPRHRQLVVMGGSFTPPRGYPLINTEPGQGKGA